MTTEFSRIERLDEIGGEDRQVMIEANDAERMALAQRFGLLAVERLRADLAIRREANGIMAHGRVTARVVQACTVTGDPLLEYFLEVAMPDGTVQRATHWVPSDSARILIGIVLVIFLLIVLGVFAIT